MPMILLCGIPSETPLRMVARRLEAADAEYVMFNQREFEACDIWFEVDAGEIRGELRIREKVWPLENFHAVYPRLMDDRCLPELEAEPPESTLRTYCRGFHDTLTRWMEIAPARVVNRCAPMATNGSKPYQSQLIREQGFLVPETLITNDPALAREFRARHGRVIYKSISSVRSIVQTMSDEDDARLEHLRWCPAQFQAFVDGTNVRVHTIGDEVFATAACTDATDYRYAASQCGEPADLQEAELSEELAQRCLRLSKSLGLDFAGIDLKITPDDEVYCFEVNPCPAFSYYEANAGQEISAGVARYLMRGSTISGPLPPAFPETAAVFACR
ncbi:MAG TPA: ATP-grasp domain-containing protein [Bryobacteraceae bacterium]|nr:ATP-grasp domain-containing protein [Bryobacteraceae bacterium]